MQSEGFYVNEKSTDTSWDRTSNLPICSTAPQPLCYRGPGREEVQLYSFFNLGARWGVSGQRHAPAAPSPGKRSGTIVQEAGWAPGLVWTAAGNIARAGIRSTDHPARGQSLYRLSHPGPYLNLINKRIFSSNTTFLAFDFNASRSCHK